MKNNNRDTKAVDSYANSIKRFLRIDQAREQELGRRIREGKDESARNELVSANLRFALDMAMKYRDRGRDDMDLISDANLGLIMAAEKFDERLRTKFVVMAYQWVRGAIIKGFKDAEVVHVPQVRGPKLDEQEVAEEVARIEEGLGMRPVDTHIYENVSARPSLDDVDACIHEPKDKESAGAADGTFEEIEMRLTIDALLDSRERYIITESVMHGRTLADVGKALGISAVRVLQIRDVALLKMRKEII